MTACAHCGDPKEAHTAKANVPVFTNTACVYAHDSDAPCFCYKYVAPHEPQEDTLPRTKSKRRATNGSRS